MRRVLLLELILNVSIIVGEWRETYDLLLGGFGLGKFEDVYSRRTNMGCAVLRDHCHIIKQLVSLNGRRLLTAFILIV